MNFKRSSTKPPPIIKKRIIRVPKRSFAPTTSTKTSSKPRSAVKEPGQITPASINKVTRSPLLARNALHKAVNDFYLQGGHNMHSHANRAREQGISLQEIEAFDLTSLYGAREDAVEQLYAKNAPMGTPEPLPPLHQAVGTPLYGDENEYGELFGWAAEEVNPSPAPRVDTPPAAPPRLMVTLPLTHGFTPINTAPAAPAAPTTATATTPRKSANRPPTPPGPPTNAVYAVESRAIPHAVQAVVDAIRLRAAKKSNKAGFPQRVDLRNLPGGMTDLDRRYGYITAGSELMKFYGDLRLFNEATWKYLVSSGKASG